MKQDIVLKNGLRFISHENNGIQMFNIALYFKSCSVYETKANNGITHLVEHLFFRQLNDITQESLYYRMEQIGTTLKAKTYKDFVCFNMLVLPQFLEEAIQIMCRILMSFNWKKENIEKEKRVVKKQIAFEYLSYSEYIDELYLKSTEYELPIMGTQKNIDRFTVPELNHWKKTFFNCNNACLVLTGNFSVRDRESVMKKIEKIENRGNTACHPNRIPERFLQRTELSDSIVKTKDHISDIWVTFDLNLNSKNFALCCFLNSILGEGVGSRLSLVLRENLALTDQIYSNIYVYYKFAKMKVELSVLNSDLEQSLKALFSVIQKIKQRVTEKDYKSSILFFTDNKKSMLDDARQLNDYYGWNHFILNWENSELNSIIEENRKITISQLEQTAKNIFKKENLMITIKNNPKIVQEKRLKKLLSALRNSL